MIFASTIISVIATPALADGPCHTLAEARARWPNSYLHYNTERHRPNGRKCWFSGPHAARVIRARIPMSRPDLTPQQRIDAAYSTFIMIQYDPPGWSAIKPRQVEEF